MSQGNQGASYIAHDFNKSLTFSHNASNLFIWRMMYEKAFPGFATMVYHPKHGEHQQAGVDRSVILENSKQILIDEKVRRRSPSGIVYSDILLEYVSVHMEHRPDVPGWVEKPLRADYIAYAIAPLGKGYLLPVPQLQTAWRLNKDRWLRLFGTKESPNRGRDGRRYMTLNCPVTVEELFLAMGKQLRLEFDPIEIDDDGLQIPSEQPAKSKAAEKNVAIPGYIADRL